MMSRVQCPHSRHLMTTHSLSHLLSICVDSRQSLASIRRWRGTKRFDCTEYEGVRGLGIVDVGRTQVERKTREKYRCESGHRRADQALDLGV